MANLLLGLAYALQLAEDGPAWSMLSTTSVMSTVKHTLTLTSTISFWLGAMRFFGHTGPLWRGLIMFAGLYLAAQVFVQSSLEPTARYTMLAGMSTLLCLAMMAAIIYDVRTFAKDFYAEMGIFAVLISGICLLNTMQFVKILDGGLQAWHTDSNFQMVFYIYMSSLAPR
ncbi:MAG: hypothetical protein RSB86_14105 [Comamonas sp.]|uniref:hypothetical protein n=1 Tax=Comamonas sp. TaxID=34028 RepID=UPI002FC8E78D